MTEMSKEAHARIKINKLLEGSGWRFFDDLHGKANDAYEPNFIREWELNLLGSTCLLQTEPKLQT